MKVMTPHWHCLDHKVLVPVQLWAQHLKAHDNACGEPRPIMVSASTNE